MKRLIVLIATALALTGAPVAAQEEMQVRGFVNLVDNSFIVAVEADAGDTGTARMAYQLLNDTDTLETDLDVTIMQSEPLDRTALRGLGADRATIYAVLSHETMQPGIILVAQEGATIYMLIHIGDELDGNLFAAYSRDVIVYGIDRSDAPLAYTEIDMEDAEGLVPSSI